MKHYITIPLTDQEDAALTQLATEKDLSRERILIQALRMYQLHEKGPKLPRKKSKESSPELLKALKTLLPK